MLTTVNADSDRLSRLIAELLDVTRIDTGRLSLYPRPSDVEVLVGRVVASVGAGTSRQVELVTDGELPDIHVDPDKFTQVVTNLIENGVRHGEGKVTVTVTRLPANAEFPGVLMTVDDEGRGIPEAIRRRVFTKFWKHGERGGSGLGMYLVNGWSVPTAARCGSATRRPGAPGSRSTGRARTDGRTDRTGVSGHHRLTRHVVEPTLLGLDGGHQHEAHRDQQRPRPRFAACTASHTATCPG